MERGRGVRDTDLPRDRRLPAGPNEKGGDQPQGDKYCTQGKPNAHYRRSEELTVVVKLNKKETMANSNFFH